MRRSLAILAVLGFGLATPAFAQDAVSDAKKACDGFDALWASGDAAKLVENFYAEKAVFIGPLPVAGILVGREAIQKNFSEGFKTFRALSANCENIMAL